MKVRTWLILGGLAVAGGAVLNTQQPGARRSLDLPVSRTSPDVRIEREYITLPDEPAARVSQGRTRNVRAAVHPPGVHAAPPLPRSRQPRGLIERARHAIVGNGKHKPEPFPRIKEHEFPR